MEDEDEEEEEEDEPSSESLDELELELSSESGMVQTVGRAYYTLYITSLSCFEINDMKWGEVTDMRLA